jgi:hypothetical protein
MYSKWSNCDQYRCKTAKENGYTATPGFNLSKSKYVAIDTQLADVSQLPKEDIQDYYENPDKFCVKNPRHRLCPNNWLKE